MNSEDVEEYRIADIINDKAFVINAGHNKVIMPGDEFIIYEEKRNIKDPISKNVLGALENIKTIGLVYEVMDKMCICTKKDYEDNTTILCTNESIKIGDKAKRTFINNNDDYLRF